MKKRGAMREISHIPIGNFPMPSKVAYQGVKGAFSYLTAKRLFGASCQLKGYPTFKETFESVEKGESEVALLPIENSLAGTIYETIDLLSEGHLHIIGETTTAVDLSLLAPPGATLSTILRVFSHEKALMQCSHFFKNHPKIEAVSYYNTAGAAADVAKEKDITTAAIAHEDVAKIYGLETILKGIQDHKENYTRFLLLSQTPSTGQRKALLLKLPHRKGSLAEVLTLLATEGANLTYIVSRPIMGRPFEYLFYVELETITELSFEALGEKTDSLKVLGSF